MTTALQPMKEVPPVPSYNEVTDERRRASFIRTIGKMFNVPESFKHIPAPNPVSIERKHLARLSGEQYVVAEKSDGVRHLLLLTKEGGRGVAVMADRAYRFWEVEVLARAVWFDRGSLFDGELVWSTRPGSRELSTRFLVFDVVMCKGASCLRESYVSRIATIRSSFYTLSDGADFSASMGPEKLAASGFIVADGNPRDLSFEPKQCFATDNLEALWRGRDRLSHGSDGLVFTPVRDHVRTGTHWSMYKWKQVNSIDLRLRCLRLGDGDEWDLRLYGGDSGLEHDMTAGGFCAEGERFVAVRSQAVDDLIGTPEAQMEGRASAIMECECVVVGDEVRCKPIKQRSDKTSPNNKFTIERTLVNIREAITFEELAAAVRYGTSASSSASPRGPCGP